MAYNFSPRIITDGLVLYLDAANTKSYPGSGTTWSDLSRGRNDGVLTNSPTFNSANGGSIVFDGNNDYVITNFTSSLLDFTVCAWFKENITSNYSRIVDKSYINGFWLGKQFGSNNTWGGGVKQASDPYGVYITLTPNVWHFICISRSNTSLFIYGDGVTNTNSTTVSNTALDSTQLRIGGSDQQVGDYFRGNISYVSIYNRALSTQEIYQNYNTTKNRYN